MWTRTRRNIAMVIGLASLLTGLLFWVLAYPPGWQTCSSTPRRDQLVRTLETNGLSVSCQKENEQEVLGLVKYNLPSFSQFITWAQNQRVNVINEQPGYFWYLRTDLVAGVGGFVTYRY